MIYLDHAATTPVPREVADAMYEVLTEQFGNPSSQYEAGLSMKRKVEDWRKTVASALGCDPKQLFFTSCGTEGDNWAIQAAAWQNRRLGRHIVTTSIEHNAVLEGCKWMAQQGYEVTYVAPNDASGVITAQDILD
ncbi:MAG: aminotransferase class V-fold PLP-dependent enzyme, partial [Oscillibacter sp.]|nr:aminotransferase class V-fold PLP-dependent enzyme [Oscillibacter sp.]